MPASKGHSRQKEDQHMGVSTLYSMYTEAISDGKLELLRMFLDTLIKNPLLAAFVTSLLLKDLKKTVTAFIKYFV